LSENLQNIFPLMIYDSQSSYEITITG